MSRTCPQCSTEFEVPPTYKRKIYCSRACSNAATADKRAAATRANKKYQPPICPCGKEVPPPQGQQYIYANQKKHCSPECRLKYGKKRQKDPANYITFNCQTCNKEVTRYRNYGSGQNKFCSNACAQKHTNVVKHYVVREIDVVLDSGWECLFAGLCYFIKLPIERMDRTSAIEWAPGQHYAPDFYLPSLDLAIEIKGNEDDDDPARWDTWRASMGKLIVLDQDGLNTLRKSPDPVSWLIKHRR